MHEFYHHLRTTAGVHKGSEKHANMYARGFIDSYKTIITNVGQKHEDPYANFCIQFEKLI